MRRLLVGALLAAAMAACGPSETPGNPNTPAPTEDASVTPHDGGSGDDAGAVDGGETANRAPQMTQPDDVTMDEGETLTVALSATDEDGDELTFSLTTGPAWASLDGSSLTLAPAAGDEGAATLTVEVSDGELSDSKSFAVTVRAATPAISAVGQRESAQPGAPEVAAGTTLDAPPVLTATVANLPASEKVRLEAEIVPESESFAGTATVQGELRAAGELILALEPLRVGTYKWQLRAVDEAGNASDWLPFAQGAAAFTLNKQTLQGSIEVASGAALTNSTVVDVAIQATPHGSATLEQMRFSTDGSSFSAWEPYAANKSGVALDASADGAKSLFVEVEDSLGNAGVFSDDIVLDTTPPQGSLTVNGGAQYTNDPFVTLTVDASDHNGIADVSFTDEGTHWTPPAPLAQTVTFQLDAVEGTRTVTARIRDLAGNEALVEDEIVLDMLEPTLSVLINGGATFTNSLQVTVALTAADATSGLDVMQFSDDNATWSAWEPFNATATWQLPPGDGFKSVYVKVRDRAGNESYAELDEISLDMTPPTGDFVIDYRNDYTQDLDVVLTHWVSDGNGSGLATMEVSNDGVTWTAPAPVVQTRDWTLSPGEGLKTVRMRFTDNAGNAGIVEDSILLDSTPPALTFTINGGATSTNNRTVTLEYTATETGSGLAYVRVSETGTQFDLTNSPATFTLTVDDGPKVLELEASDEAVNISRITATIFLDQTAPTLAVFSINSGATYTNSTSVFGTNVASDDGSGLAEICLGASINPTDCQPYGSSPAITLQGPDGLKTLYAVVKDAAGNRSAALSDAITLDTTPPTIASVILEGGAPYTTDRSIEVGTSATDAFQISLSLDAGATWSSWMAWTPSVTYTLPIDQGPYTVHARVKDYADNVSVAPHPSDSITLDTSRPTGSVVIDDGAPATNTANVTLTLTASDNLSGVAHYCAKTTSIAPNATDACWRPFATNVPFTLASGDGIKPVYVWFRDGAGLVSQTASQDDIRLDTSAPFTPTNLAVRAGHRELELSWTAPIDYGSGVASYDVETSTTGASWLPAGNTTTTTALVTGLPNGVLQFVRVIAIDVAGNRSTPVTGDGTPRFPLVAQQRLPTSATLHDVYMASASSAVVVGEGGLILTTHDRGATFTRRDPLVDFDLRHLASAPLESMMVAVGDAGTIVHSRDGGRTWHSSLNASSSDLRGVTYAGGSPSRFVAVGERRILTSNGGTSFSSPMIFGQLPSFRAVGWVTGGNSAVVAVGDEGTIWRSSDGGSSWTPVAPPVGYTAADFRSFAPVPGEGTCWLGAVPPTTGSSGLLFSSDGGRSWTTINLAAVRDMTVEAIVPLSATEAVAAGSVVDASGKTLPRIVKLAYLPPYMPTATVLTQPTGSVGPAFGLAMYDATRGLWVGEAGQVNATADGTSWASRSSGRPDEVRDIAMVDRLVGFAVGRGDYAWRTLDGGATWQAHGFSVNGALYTNQRLNAVAAPVSSVVFAVGGNGRIWSPSTLSWQQVAQPVNSELYDIDCLSQWRCAAVGADASIVDYDGAGWTTVNLSPGGDVYRAVAFFVDFQRAGIAVGDGGALRTMYDDVWTARTPIAGRPNLKAIEHATSTLVAIAVGDGGAMVKTTDRGETWTALASGTTGDLRSVVFAGNQTWYAAGPTVLLKSTDNGATWQQLYTGVTTTELWSVTALRAPATDVWVVGANGTVLYGAEGGE